MVLSKIKDALEKRGEKDPARLVALDIGTEFVKALIGEIDGEAIKVKGVARTRQKLSDMHSGAIADIAGVVENCDKALTEAENMAGVSARQAVIGIAGELVKGTTTTIRYQRSNTSKRIDMDELTQIMKKVQERAFDRAQAQLAWESGNPDLEVKLVNSALVSVHIDGYKVTNPIGFQGKDVAVQLYTAFAPLVHIGAFERAAEELDLILTAVPAQPFAVARSVIASDANNPFSAVLIDVGGGTTDIAVVNEGGVEGTKMFGIGGRSFTQKISSSLGVDFDRAEEIKLKASAGELEKDQTEKTEKAIESTLKVWRSGVELALSEYRHLDHLPHRILLCGGGASLTQLVDRLKEEDWHKDLPFTRPPQVDHIQPQEVVNVTDETGEITDHTFITAMGMLRIGQDTLMTGSGRSESISDTMNRLLRV